MEAGKEIKEQRDCAASKAYEEIANLAREHALIHQAASGVIVIVHPDTQKAEGIYEQIQWVHGKGPHPATANLTAAGAAC